MVRETDCRHATGEGENPILRARTGHMPYVRDPACGAVICTVCAAAIPELDLKSHVCRVDIHVLLLSLTEITIFLPACLVVIERPRTPRLACAQPLDVYFSRSRACVRVAHAI